MRGDGFGPIRASEIRRRIDDPCLRNMMSSQTMVSPLCFVASAGTLIRLAKLAVVSQMFPEPESLAPLDLERFLMFQFCPHVGLVDLSGLY